MVIGGRRNCLENSQSWTRRKAADMRTAQEVSAAFRLICPEDPARYDFAITRLGIRRENDAAAALLEAARALRRGAKTS